MGAGSLIRNQSIEIRVSHREHALKQFKVGPNRTLSGKEMVLMIEWVENGYWRNKSLVAQPSFEVARLINCSFFRKNPNEALNFVKVASVHGQGAEDANARHEDRRHPREVPRHR